MANRLRRSILWVPADSERKIIKSIQSNTDVVVLDLEDGTAQGRKEEGRLTARKALLEFDFGKIERGVRINPLSTNHGERDIEITIQGQPDFYAIPKLRSEQDVKDVSNLISKYEKLNNIPEGQTKIAVIATETPEAVLNLSAIAKASPRNTLLFWGPLDLAGAIGARRIFNPQGEMLDVFRLARSLALLTANANNLDVIDTVFEDLNNEVGLRKESQEAYWMGFTGKSLIHPNQIDPVNEVFIPTQKEIIESQKLIQAFVENERNGFGAFRYEGKMVDAPHLKRAERIIELAKQANLVS